MHFTHLHCLHRKFSDLQMYKDISNAIHWQQANLLHVFIYFHTQTYEFNHSLLLTCNIMYSHYYFMSVSRDCHTKLFFSIYLPHIFHVIIRKSFITIFTTSPMGRYIRQLQRLYLPLLADTCKSIIL